MSYSWLSRRNLPESFQIGHNQNYLNYYLSTLQVNFVSTSRGQRGYVKTVFKTDKSLPDKRLFNLLFSRCYYYEGTTLVEPLFRLMCSHWQCQRWATWSKWQSGSEGSNPVSLNPAIFLVLNVWHLPLRNHLESRDSQTNRCFRRHSCSWVPHWARVGRRWVLRNDATRRPRFWFVVEEPGLG